MNDKELEKLRAEVIEFNMEHFAELHSDMETIDIVYLIARHFAEWGINHLADADKMIDEDLEKEITAIHERYPEVSFAKLSRICVRIAKWQKQQDQETIELAEDHAMLAGMEKMKEQMMKNIVCGTVCKDGSHVWIELVDNALPDYKDCDPIDFKPIRSNENPGTDTGR